MQLLDLTLETAAENLALDEALLDAAANSAGPLERLRLWEPAEFMVVVGSSSRVANEVNVAACRAQNVPILRRPSGGAPIVTGPGCLMYAVVLSHELRPELRMIDRAHLFVLEAIAAALKPLAPEVERAGISDLAIANRKFSGNSLRCKRTHLLYHGTLLYQFPLDRVEALLKMPQRQPDYRRRRKHSDFLTNLPLQRQQLRQSLVSAFNATEALTDWPRELTARLAAEKYNRLDWNERF